MINKEKMIDMYRKMTQTRILEERLQQLHTKGVTKGPIHLCIGQEAVGIGACAALRKNDYITSNHRGHAHYIGKGIELNKLVAEIFGKSTGYCKGKAGHMLVADVSIGLFGGCGIVGDIIPIAVGEGLSIKMSGTDQVVVCFFGDGASNTGAFHEALNLAAIWKVPVIFLCENNNLAVSTPVSYSCGSPDIYRRGLGYGVESELINGDDVFEVYLAVKRVSEEIRKEPHPVLIEAITHRQIGHWVGDPQKYRTAEELADLPNHDPLRIFLTKVKDRSDVTNSDLEGVESKVVAGIKKAADFADKSSYPPLENATKDYLKE